MTTATISKNDKKSAKIFGRCAECRIPMVPGLNVNGVYLSSDGCGRPICDYCHWHAVDPTIFMKSPYLR